MQPIDSESPEQAITSAVIGQELQASAQVKGLQRTFIAPLRISLSQSQ
jgi:hypothetical protein